MITERKVSRREINKKFESEKDVREDRYKIYIK
jgi:hypothetical protein